MKIVGGYRADTWGVDSNGCPRDWITDETDKGSGRNGSKKKSRYISRSTTSDINGCLKKLKPVFY